MVCPRCIDTVRGIFTSIGLEIVYIHLGEVRIVGNIENQKKEILRERLIHKGFELLENKNSKLIAQTKSIVINQIHQHNARLKVNFSTLISETLKVEYTALSKLFSSVEGITIERYIRKQKIEKVKELITYNELSLSEIAFQINYSSVAHLSSQFKKETGMTPTAFKKLKERNRNSLDSI